MDLRPYRALHSIQLVRETLRRWWGLELAIADSKGYVVDHADGKIFPSQNELCRLALFSKEGFRRCNESIKVVGDRLRTGRGGGPGEAPQAFIHQCHLGFDVVAAPIWAGPELVGFLFTGGSWKELPGAGGRAELLRKVREFAAVETDAAAQHTDDVPRLPEPELERLRDLIAYGAAEITKVLASRTPRPEVAGPVDHPFTDIVGQSQGVRDVIKLLEKIVRSESTVLIHGESGTGKELIARAIHYHGPRAKQPFVVQNCSAFNDNLLESALFGHVRGAFTGAVKDQKGLFEVADNGTFFLDEIGDMSPSLQVKLLRVLQEGTFTPVGGTKPIKVDVRIVAASHKDLQAMVARREFREDLYYRVNVLKVTLPPLRERVADIPVLADHFLRKHWTSRGHGGAVPRLADATLDAMVRYQWPGNIRELENEVERMLVLGGDGPEIGPEVLSTRIRAGGEPVAPRAAPTLTGTLREVMESVESDVILQGLIRTHWNKSQLAKELGISRSYLIQKCTYYGLERKD
ncbi:MAG: sigma 54-interacting transcriptional regulator [Kofleriaceae bacterium]|nr:sigma 54-interacting transcriptional regulator [Myxococcales bacterium]MCB9565051.1 sigma 54-interacting transcriptional regulator [Kofleriaceae bacterium]MCB9573778.1 sigma 54-interacting transcriptional regulator [Kofleriaceae bacterium]